jgi:RimJ/RimL family protein N-acetyltransferase
MIIAEPLYGKFTNMRSVAEDDAEFILKLRLDSYNSQFINKTENNLEKQIEWIRLQRLRPDDYYFLFTDKENNKAGVISLYNIGDKVAESGRFISFGSSVQNMEAVLMHFDYAYHELGINLVHFTVSKINKKVANMWKRLGIPMAGETTANGTDSYYFELAKVDYENVLNPNITAVLEKMK